MDRLIPVRPREAKGDVRYRISEPPVRELATATLQTKSRAPRMLDILFFESRIPSQDSKKNLTCIDVLNSET